MVPPPPKGISVNFSGEAIHRLFRHFRIPNVLSCCACSDYLATSPVAQAIGLIDKSRDDIYILLLTPQIRSAIQLSRVSKCINARPETIPFGTVEFRNKTSRLGI